MKNFNKKILIGLLVLGSITSSAVVFAGIDVSVSFRQEMTGHESGILKEDMLSTTVKHSTRR